MPTLRELVSAYLAQKERECAAGVYSPGSLARARWYLASFLRWMEGRADQTIRAARRSDVITWILSNPQWRSNSTRTDAAGAVVSCFRWCEAEPLIPAGSSPYRRAGPWGQTSPRAAITESEFQALIQQTKVARHKRGRQAFRRALWFLWATGCRTCEMRVVRWSDVDWRAGIIVLRAHKTKKASGRPRLIPLCRKARLYLRWLRMARTAATEAEAVKAKLAFRADEGRIFLNSRRRPWTKDQFARRFREYARLADVREEVSAYSLRHGFASEGLRRGISDTAVAQVLGHLTTRYVRYYGRSVEIEAEYLNGVARLIRRRRR